MILFPAGVLDDILGKLDKPGKWKVRPLGVATRILHVHRVQAATGSWYSQCPGSGCGLYWDHLQVVASSNHSVWATHGCTEGLPVKNDLTHIHVGLHNHAISFRMVRLVPRMHLPLQNR